MFGPFQRWSIERPPYLEGGTDGEHPLIAMKSLTCGGSQTARRIRVHFTGVQQAGYMCTSQIAPGVDGHDHVGGCYSGSMVVVSLGPASCSYRVERRCCEVRILYSHSREATGYLRQWHDFMST